MFVLQLLFRGVRDAGVAMSQLFDTRSLLRDMILAGMEETFLRLEAEVNGVARRGIRDRGIDGADAG
jgi:hypothetical protein